MRVPWCRFQLEQPNIVALPRLDNEADGRGSTGELFSAILNSPSTISHRVIVFESPASTILNKEHSQRPWLPVPTCTVFYALCPGLCGFGELCHGGIQTTLLDDIGGILSVLNARLQDGLMKLDADNRWAPKGDTGMLDLSDKMFATKGLQVQFLRPLRAPTVVQVTASVKEIADDGNSFLLSAQIKDGNSREYGRAQASWIVFRPKAKL